MSGLQATSNLTKHSRLDFVPLPLPRSPLTARSTFVIPSHDDDDTGIPTLVAQRLPDGTIVLQVSASQAVQSYCTALRP